MPTARSQPSTHITLELPHTVAERIDGHQHVSNVCLCLRQSLSLLMSAIPGHAGLVPEGSTHVDFAILKALLEIFVDRLVGHLADQCEI
jgi:hypothetical protein